MATETIRAVDIVSDPDENFAKLQYLLLSADECNRTVFYSEPAGREVWDVASRKKSVPRGALFCLTVGTCAKVVSSAHSGVRFLIGG